MKKLVSNRLLKSSLPVLLIILAVAGCGGGSYPIFNITGTWFLFHTTTGTAGEQGPDLFTFTTSKNTVAGTTPGNQVISGDVNVLNVEFSWIGSDNATNSYSGVVGSDGATMTGTWSDNSGKSGTWTAFYNMAPTLSIAGNWNIFHTTTGTAGELGPDSFAMSQTGSVVSGTTQDSLAITGTVTTLKVNLFWTGKDGAVYTYTGLVTADGVSMSGTWTNNSGQSGTWRAAKSG